MEAQRENAIMIYKVRMVYFDLDDSNPYCTMDGPWQTNQWMSARAEWDLENKIVYLGDVYQINDNLLIERVWRNQKQIWDNFTTEKDYKKLEPELIFFKLK